MLEGLKPYEFELSNGEKLKVLIEDVSIAKPRVTQQIDVKERRIFPAEARQRAVTYSGNCTMTLGWWKSGKKQSSVEFDLGPIPLMIRVSFAFLSTSSFNDYRSLF
jgi:DNA-directed RNA polymerase beta subunit